MDTVSSLQTMYETEIGSPLPLPDELERLYGPLAFPLEQDRPHLISDFVQTIDGVVTLGIPGHEGGGDLSGHNREDVMVLGLLRAAADAVIMTSTSLKVGGNRLHSAAEAFPPLADSYGALRSRLGKPILPLQVVVTASGKIPADHAIFHSKEAPVLVLTTEAGEGAARARGLPSSIPVVAFKGAGDIGARRIVDVVSRHLASGTPLLLSEAGPHLFGDFLAANCLNELFLTVAPQLAGRAPNVKRTGLVSHHIFAPEDTHWAELVSAKRGESFLFLRYRFHPVPTG